MIFPVEVFKIFAQGRVHPLLCTFQLVFTKTQLSLVKGFSHLSPNSKSAKVGPHSGSELSADSSSSTPSGFFIDENVDVWMRLPGGRWTLLGSDEHVIRDEPG